MTALIDSSTPRGTSVRVRMGGLFQCCIATAASHSRRDPPEGETTTCTTCQAPMVFRAGAWQWLRLVNPPRPNPQQSLLLRRPLHLRTRCRPHRGAS